MEIKKFEIQSKPIEKDYKRYWIVMGRHDGRLDGFRENRITFRYDTEENVIEEFKRNQHWSDIALHGINQWTEIAK